MNNTKSLLTLGAIAAGLIFGSSAMAHDPKAGGDESEKMVDKDSCKGMKDKESCKGKKVKIVARE